MNALSSDVCLPSHQRLRDRSAQQIANGQLRVGEMVASASERTIFVRRPQPQSSMCRVFFRTAAGARQVAGKPNFHH